MSGNNCCQVTCAVLCWKDPAKSGMIFALGNMLLLSLYLEVPLFTYFVTYGGLLALVAGAACKVGKLCDTESISLERLVSKDQLEKGVGAGYSYVNSLVESVLPIILWEDVIVSFGCTVGLYLATSVLEMISLAMLCFLAFNVAFIYGKFQDQIRPVAAPHLKKASLEMEKLWAKVPRYELPASIAAVVTPKKSARVSEKSNPEKNE